jgi:hypothetical protein
VRGNLRVSLALEHPVAFELAQLLGKHLWRGAEHEPPQGAKPLGAAGKVIEDDNGFPFSPDHVNDRTHRESIDPDEG